MSVKPGRSRERDIGSTLRWVFSSYPTILPSRCLAPASGKSLQNEVPLLSRVVRKSQHDSLTRADLAVNGQLFRATVSGAREVTRGDHTPFLRKNSRLKQHYRYLNIGIRCAKRPHACDGSNWRSNWLRQGWRGIARWLRRFRTRSHKSEIIPKEICRWPGPSPTIMLVPQPPAR